MQWITLYLACFLFLIYHLGNSEVFLCLGICVEIQICKYLHSSYSCSQKKLTPPPFSSHYTRVTTQHTQCDHHQHHSFMQSNFQSLNNNQMSWLFWFFILLYFHSYNHHFYLKCSPSLKETFRRDRNIFMNNTIRLLKASTSSWTKVCMHQIHLAITCEKLQSLSSEISTKITPRTRMSSKVSNTCLLTATTVINEIPIAYHKWDKYELSIIRLYQPNI